MGAGELGVGVERALSPAVELEVERGPRGVLSSTPLASRSCQPAVMVAIGPSGTPNEGKTSFRNAD
jgi:hypothetical protein